MRHTRYLTKAFVLLLGCAAFSACSDNANQPAGGPAAGPAAQAAPSEVGVITLRPQQIPFTASVPGRTLASAVSEIRPQVNGIIQQRVFKEGSEVKAGDVLYKIDDRTYRAAVESAQAGVQRAQATINNAQAESKRLEELGRRGVSTQQQIDAARAALLQAQADLASANAAVQTAQINLDNTQVTAPISGLIATSAVTEGALVTANQTTALTTIRQVDPMNVDLTESSANILRVRRMIDAGLVQFGPKSVNVRLALEDGTAYPEVGKIEAVEGSVSQTTGSTTIRVSIANPRRILMPGMYVRASVEVATTGTGFLLPERAVSRNAKGQGTAMFVAADGTAELRILQTEQTYQNAWIVREGVKEGDKLIVDGLQKVRGGQPVRAIEVTLDEQGLVKAADGSAAASSP